MKTYTVDYAFDVCGYKWIVYKNLSASLREKYQVCESKHAADKLAERLNDGEENIMRGSQIKKSHWHDAGAYGKCSYCRRYSDDINCLDDDYGCECGKKNGFSGSFVSPDENSRWSS